MPTIDSLSDALLAAGALGTAAFGLVESLKRSPWLARGAAPGMFAWRAYQRVLGQPLLVAADRVLDAGSERAGTSQGVVAAAFLVSPEEGAATARKALRLLMASPELIAAIVPTDQRVSADGRAAGHPDGRLAVAWGGVSAAVSALRTADEVGEGGGEPAPAARTALQTEQALLEARLDAAASAAGAAYGSSVRLWATSIALVAGAVAGGLLVDSGTAGGTARGIAYGLGIGAVAVPIAPLAKDLSSLLKTATDALSSFRR